MKRVYGGLILTACGVACGVAVAGFWLAFTPRCGEDCASTSLMTLAWCVVAGAVLFPVLGLSLWKRSGGRPMALLRVAAGLVALTVLPALVCYVYTLHQRYSRVAIMFELPDVDFSLMAIATQPVSVLGSGTPVHIKAWERCALGVVRCDRTPRTVEARCLGSGTVVEIAESDWPAFRRIPQEDLTGLAGVVKTMELCRKPGVRSNIPTFSLDGIVIWHDDIAAD